MPEAWDRADAETLVVLSRADGACSRETSSDNSAPAAYEKRTTSGVVERGTSELHVVDVLSGELLAQHVATCGGDRFDMVTHEARYAADGGVVLTATYAPRRVRVSAVTCCDDAGRPDPEATFDVVVGATIDAWDPERGTFETLYDLSDVSPLPDDGARLAGATWNVVDAGCDERKEALDYFHVSSVSVSEVTGDLIVASRNLNVVWSLRRDGSGPRWALDSAALPEAWRFYAPHAARQLPDGDVLLVDDGNSRPGCVHDAAECFSRVVSYRLLGDGAWTLVSSFAYPSGAASGPEAAGEAGDLYNAVGGSATPRGDGGLVVGFTSLLSTRARMDVAGGLVLDVDADGAVDATAALPVDGGASQQNGYRFVPWDSVAGESDEAPFFDDGTWELYKHALAVGPGGAADVSAVVGALFGPREAVLNLGCDGRKVSVDLLPHGPQLHWVEAPLVVAGAASVATTAAATEASHAAALEKETFASSMRDAGPGNG